MRTPGILLTGALGAMALAACGGKVIFEGGGGAGGNATSSVGSLVGTGTSTSVVTTGPQTTTVGPTTTVTTGGDPCSTGQDCTLCSNLNDCYNCANNTYPKGAQLYNDLVTCVICDACYFSCDGANSGCPGMPMMKSPCENGTCNGGSDPNDCVTCAQNTTCAPPARRVQAGPGVHRLREHRLELPAELKSALTSGRAASRSSTSPAGRTP
jgi:hypothetical protein